MIAVNKLQKQNLYSILYSVVTQAYTPAPSTPAILLLTVLANFFNNVFQQHNGGVTLFTPANFAGNFKTGFNYVPCYKTKYIFILGMNKFE